MDLTIPWCSQSYFKLAPKMNFSFTILFQFCNFVSHLSINFVILWNKKLFFFSVILAEGAGATVNINSGQVFLNAGDTGEFCRCYVNFL